MSERGIEIHNGKVVIPGDVMKELQLGTWASPLTQTEADQVVVSAVVNAIALGGDVHGGYFGVKGSVTATANLRGLRARVTINDGITITGFTYGLHIETEVLGAGVAAGLFEGMRLEKYVESGADLTGATVYGIHIANSIASAPSSYSFMRMSENAASTVDSIFLIVKGASCLGMTYLFDVVGQPPIFFTTVGTPSGDGGQIVVRMGGNVRYIKLWTTSA